MRRLLLALAPLVAAACGHPFWTPRPEPVFPQPVLAGRVTSIALHHTGCLGTCPAWSFRLTRSGVAYYRGAAFSPILGDYEAPLDRAQFTELADRLVRHGFFAMPASSPCLLDVPRTILTAAIDDTVKVVESCGRGAPERFYDLTDAVENVASRLPWHIR